MNTQNNEYDIPLNHITLDKNKPAEQSGAKDDSLNYNAVYGLAKDSPIQVSDDVRLYSKLNTPNIKQSEYDIPGKTLPERVEMKSERGFIEKLKMKKLVCFLLIMITTVTIATSVCLSIAFVEISELRSEIAAVLQQSEPSPSPSTNTSPSPSDTTAQNPNNGLGSFGEVFNPAASCAAVLALDPSSPSGYYWIRFNDGSVVNVFCDMTRSCGGVTGGWMRVAELDMTNSSSQCPSSLTERTDSSIHACGIASAEPSCSSVTLPTGVTYSKICGRFQAYQNGSTDAFADDGRGTNPDIDTYYVDGISLTHGSPRQHIWTFAAALDEVATTPSSNCPCTNDNIQDQATPPPAFVGGDYFCETGSQNLFQFSMFYGEDPLWDGAGCGSLSSCCLFNSPPWFYKQLPTPTTDDIEIRVCRDELIDNEDVVIESYEIYIR